MFLTYTNNSTLTGTKKLMESTLPKIKEELPTPLKMLNQLICQDPLKELIKGAMFSTKPVKWPLRATPPTDSSETLSKKVEFRCRDKDNSEGLWLEAWVEMESTPMDGMICGLTKIQEAVTFCQIPNLLTKPPISELLEKLKLTISSMDNGSSLTKETLG